MTKKIFLRLHEKRRIIDAVILVISFELTRIIPIAILQISISRPLLLLLVLLFSWYIAAANTKLYKDRISNKYVEEIVIVLNTLIIQFILIAAFLYAYNKQLYISSWQYFGGGRARSRCDDGRRSHD